MKKQARILIIAALGLFAAPLSVSAATIVQPDISITEVPTWYGGSYTVTNNTSDAYLLGFGVSNTFSQARVGNENSTFGCQPGYCYGAVTVDWENWDTETAYNDENGDSVTFAAAFGAFSDNVEADETTINWYRASDGALGPGQTSSNFFLFNSNSLTSVALGVLSGPNGTITTFQNQPVSTVPLPPAAWLFGSAMVGLLGLARRKTT